jgi:hypothetical protein
VALGLPGCPCRLGFGFEPKFWISHLQGLHAVFISKSMQNSSRFGSRDFYYIFP